MLARSELHTLAQWCLGNAIRWSPAAPETGRPAMMLEPHHGRLPWRRYLLVLVDEGFSLMTEKGETLATASELPAVLDAIERPRQAACAAVVRHAVPARDEASACFVF